MLRRDTYLPFGQPDFGDLEIQAVSQVLRAGWVGMGGETLAFERELAAACGASAVVAVNSCTSALFLSLMVLGVGPGDEVVVPSLTWISTANAVRHLGATVVFADISPDTLCVTPASVRAALSPRTRVVIVVHYGGYAVDVAAVRQAIPAHIAVLEDAAHAWGSRYEDGNPVGASGNLTCFSFYANKNLSTGEGGAIALPEGTEAERLRSLRQHGLPQDAWKRFTDPRRLEALQVTELGYKMNYTDLQASIGRAQLSRQAEFAARRLAIAETYVDALSSCGWPIAVQDDILAAGHARHLFVVQLPVEALGLSRRDVLQALRDRNVGASLHYHPVHLMPLYADARPGILPVTERVAQRILTLPIGTAMTPADATFVGRALREVLDTGVQRRAAGA